MPAVSEKVVRVEGLRECRRAFNAADKAQGRELVKGLKRASEPVRSDAENRAVQRIENLDEGDPWSRMRVGVTTSLVYVAPKERGRKSGRLIARRRSNLADLLMERAMMPALDAHVGDVLEELDHVLETVGSIWERA